MMTLRIRLLVVAVIVLCLLVVAILVRRREIKSRYLVTWTAFCLLALPFAIFPHFTDTVFNAIGIYYSPAGLLLLAVILLFLVSVQFSREITALEEKVRLLAEELALARLEPRSEPPAEREPAQLREAGRH